MLQAQHGSSDAARLRTGDAHNPDAATARRRGDGDDGVVEVHGEIVAGEGSFRGAVDNRALLVLDGSETPSPSGQSGQGFPRGLARSRLVVLRIHHHVAAQAFAFALGAQVRLVAQRQVDDAALAR